MTCFHPLQAAWIPGEGGKPLIYAKGTRPEPLTGGYEALSLPCGQCDGCRIDKSKEWAARIIHESQMHQHNSFVTLTYNAENLPNDRSLNKQHFQKFMKRLRKHNEPKKIRYFHCGEYGGEVGQRPHYHACLFGLDFDDRVAYSTTNDVITYQSDTLEKIWGKGFATCGELNYQTAAYTARYIMKKITGAKAEQHYLRTDEGGRQYLLQPEYITMSLGRNKGQGIGGSFYEKYKTDFFPRDECPIPGKGVYKGVPQYYANMFAEEDPDTYAKIKEARKLYRDTHKHEYTAARLQDKEEVKKAQLSQLPRH